MKRLWLALFLLALSLGSTAAAAPRSAEILWDKWGVPHVSAKDTQSLFYAFGWAQMQSHGNLLLRLYGESRGRAAEYWGQENYESDKWVRTM